MSTVPEIRLRAANDEAVREDGRHVLYWMIAARRTRWNFGLQRAVEEARRLGRPLIVLEALRCDYRWASDRLHRFVIEGMRDNAERFAGSPVRYHSHVEPEKGAGRGLLRALAKEACLVVTDDFPCFFLPAMVEAAAKTLARDGVRLETVDSNGLLPMAAGEKVFPTAHSFRRFLQKTLPAHFGDFPRRDPLARLDLPKAAIPREVLERWPAPTRDLLEGDGLAALPIDHSVGPGEAEGGERAGAARLRDFLETRLDHYGEGRNHPDDDAASGLSPWLHFGHVSAHQVFEAVADREGWRPAKVAPKASGSREGWWGMSSAAESFLDELVTWREVGYNRCHLDPDYDDFETLPPWALETLAEHESDEREHVYTLEELAEARTHDEIWNAAQRQLARSGRMHNYLRMLWGKRVLEWTESPREACERLIELNNRFATDGRNPNSYSGIFWCFGRYDRPWGPERPIFGKVRYMSSENTRRKLKLNDWLSRWAD